MKTCIKLLTVLVCVLFSTAAKALTTNVSVSDALRIAQQQFSGKDVDYYVCSPNDLKTWLIFVDADPMKGWEHECYLLDIPKTSLTTIRETSPSIRKMKMPPSGYDYVPLSVKNRYTTAASNVPYVPKNTQANTANDVAGRTYAIILSGGVNRMANYERYWNDGSFIYQTLANNYCIPKEHIYPLMSDGSDPAQDVRCIAGGFKSQNLDLDNDGINDIKLAATKNNISNILDSLSNIMQPDDHLFIYVIDHGGTANNSSYICLWNNETLYDYELADMLTPLTNNFVNISVVLGQCYSGGFIESLTKAGCVVASASASDESSWACGDIPYDEFVYQWTCGVNGANHLGASNSYKADTDSNGRVTMEEAFAYAKANDRQTAEHPQYVSIPTSIGEDLAFNHIAPSIDLYVKDNPEDTGKEPNMTTDKFWLSPSICVRNEEDGIFEHENPEYSSTHQIAYVYVRVYNRGKKDYVGGNFLHVYWAQASTGLSDKVWKGLETYNNKYPTGGHMDAKAIDSIKAGEYRDVPVRWLLPELLYDYPEGNFHFCLAAKIMESAYDDGYVDGKIYFDKKGSNNVAQKNVTIIRNEDACKQFAVYVRNVYSTEHPYTLELVPRTTADEEVYTKASVEMEMSEKVYSAWKRGGCMSQGISEIASNSTISEAKSVRFLSAQSQLQKVSLNAYEFDMVKIKFNFSDLTSESNIYTFDLIQRNDSGEIVGGETFIVESPILALSTPLNIISSPDSDGSTRLTVDGAVFKSVIWENQQGETIGDNKTITLAPSANNQIITVTATTDEGLTTESVNVIATIGIKSLALDESQSIRVSLFSASTKNSCISIVSTNDGETKITKKIETGQTTVDVNMGELPKGVYAVCYYIDNNIIDKKKILIK